MWVLLLSPAESANQAINNANLKLARAGSCYQKISTSCNTKQTRPFRAVSSLVRVKGFMPSYAATGLFTNPSLLCTSRPWQRREDHLPWPRIYKCSSTAS